jgi:hypothetical protein
MAKELTNGANGESAQPFLFSEQTLEAITDAERVGEYTLERVRTQRPELIPEVIHLRGQRLGILRIAKIVRAHPRTIMAIIAEYPEEIGKEQDRLARLCFTTAEVLIEEVLENPHAVPANVRCLAASQMIDKGQLLYGLATARVEHTAQAPQISNLEEYEAIIRPLEQKARARIIENEAAQAPALVDSTSDRE